MAEPTPERIFTGGLMRCCLQTLDERTVPATEGEEQPCKWCSSGAVFRDGGWRWIGPKVRGDG